MVSGVRKTLRLQLLPMALGFAALVAIVGAQSWLTATQQVENQKIRAAFALDRRVASTLSLLQDAETGQGGFLLTGEESYLEPYHAAVAALPVEMDAIREEVAGQPLRREQFDQLASAAEEKLGLLAEGIRLHRSGDAAGALELVQTGRGRIVMDRVRMLVREIQRDENALLQQRLDASERADAALQLASIAVLLSVLAVAAYGMAALRRRLRDIAAAQQSLTAKNAALESEIATRQAAEAQMRQMQKMEAIGQLTGGIAHDFNNMLAVIMSAMSLAKRKLSRGDTDIAKFVDAAADAAQRAADLTKRLLAFARQQPLAPQVIDANGTVRGMSKLLRRTLGRTIEVETVLAAGLWPTHADASQLENAILNLAVNGRDAMPDGGTLTIETANRSLDAKDAAENPDLTAGDHVMVAVTDTGVGMLPEVAAQAFDPFFTTKSISKGTGLGLSQVYGFVRQSGGHVTIRSAPGEGTTVSLYLRRYLGDEQPSQAAAAFGEPNEAARELVLVTEDDPQVREGSVAALRDLGYRVLQAADGDEALRMIDRHPRIDLLLTDIVMPGMDGRALAAEARKRRPGLKVLFTTGFTRETVVHDAALERGLNFIAKPFTVDQLSAKLRELLG